MNTDLGTWRLLVSYVAQEGAMCKRSCLYLASGLGVAGFIALAVIIENSAATRLLTFLGLAAITSSVCLFAYSYFQKA